MNIELSEAEVETVIEELDRIDRSVPAHAVMEKLQVALIRERKHQIGKVCQISATCIQDSTTFVSDGWMGYAACEECATKRLAEKPYWVRWSIEPAGTEK